MEDNNQPDSSSVGYNKHTFTPPPAINSQLPPPDYSQPFTPPGSLGPQHAPTNAGLVVLQWLTYAFWGWTVLAMSILTATVLASFISDADTGSFMPYGIASVLVLLPIAIVCDLFYSKQEPAKKIGAASVVMIIHAVLFALFGIGALIGIVISLVTMFTSSGDSSNTQVALYSTMIITLLYGVVFLRTVNPAKTPWVRRFFPIFMTIVVGVISVLGIVGPVANARLTRNDRLISDNISTIQQSVTDYSNNNKKLPDDLRSLSLTGDPKTLVDENLVTYKPNTKSATTSADINYGSYSSSIGTKSTTTVYYYQLCVGYKKASDGGYSYTTRSQPTNTYQSYISAYTHPEGKVCYNLKTSAY